MLCCAYVMHMENRDIVFMYVCYAALLYAPSSVMHTTIYLTTLMLTSTTIL